MAQSKYFLGEWKDVADGEFVVARAFPANGEMLEPGTPFDKEGIEQRRLRLLYETRYITTADIDSAGREGTVEREEEVEGDNDTSEDENASPEPSVAETKEEASEEDEEPVEDEASEEDEEPVEDEAPKRVGKVVKGKAGWLHVEDENGNKVGDSTRDEDEAELIKLSYEDGEIEAD